MQNGSGQCIQKEGSSILDYTVEEYRSSQEILYFRAADVGNTDHCQIWTGIQQMKATKRIGGAGGCTNGGWAEKK